MHEFSRRLIAWQRAHGRHDLPWQVSDPYSIWLSEIMLQQTQVDTVIPYYRRFVARFPDISSLATAEVDAVLALWSGLGYYARARNLHAAARRMQDEHGGRLPRRFEDIVALPGVGRSTAAAIAVFAYGERRAILDGNVKRVLCRLYGIEGWPGERNTEAELWTLAESLLPEDDIRAYTQGLMDLGATLCRRGRPDCGRCPHGDDCRAYLTGRQAELPAARPRKSIPEKSTRMLIALHGEAILLEKRPPTGVWGGLWSLPECPLDVDARSFAEELGLTVESMRDLPGLVHVFTHFRLTIRPTLVRVSRIASAVRAPSPASVWLPTMDALDAALPAPARRLIAGIQDMQAVSLSAF